MRIIILLLVLFTISCTGQPKITIEHTLIKNNKAVYKIVFPENASEVEINAANQLKRYLDTLSNAKFVLNRENQIKTGDPQPAIFIGQTRMSKQKDIAASIAKLGDDGVLLTSSNNHIILYGQGPRATLYAVYEFLEQFVGFKFYAPSVTAVPKASSVTIPGLNYSYSPPFTYRSHYSFNAMYEAEFSTILRQNSEFQPLAPIWGEAIKILGFVHTFSIILPPEKYFAAHPEWYSDPSNGHLPSTKRSILPGAQETQLCLTNVALKKQFLANTLDWIKENPNYNIVSISQNDNKGYCKCQNCLAIIKQEGAGSGLLLRFINDIAKVIAVKYPDKKIETLSYFFSEKPPLVTRPYKNVVMRFAPIDADMAHGIASNQNASVRDNVLGWSKISKNNFYWGYNTNFKHVLLPYPSLSHFKEDMNFLRRNQFQGIYIQDNTNPEGYGYFTAMQTWVIAKLLWNPDLNDQVLLDEFFTGYYGASAGAYLKDYYLLVQREFLKSNLRLEAFHLNYSFFSKGLIEKGETLFGKALAAAPTQILKERVQKEKISLDFAKLYVQNSQDVNSPGYKKAYLDFFSKLESNKSGNIYVDKALSNYRVTMVDELENVRNRSFRKTESSSIVLQQSFFTYFKIGELTGVVVDKHASDNVAAYINGSTKEWAIQIPLNDKVGEKLTNNWQVVFNLKVLAKLDQGLINFGVSDAHDKANNFSSQVAVKQLRGSGFKECELKNVKINKDTILWISITNENDAVERLLIDKIELKNISN